MTAASSAVTALCSDGITFSAWCAVPMPVVSHFSCFEPPNNNARWRQAQLHAANGDQILLQRVLPHFPNHLDLLDGDITFAATYRYADFFLDKQNGLDVLTASYSSNNNSNSNYTNGKDNVVRQRFEGKIYPWEAKETRSEVLPPPYDFNHGTRAPIIQMGYSAFSRKNTPHYFSGPRLGGTGREYE